MVRHRKFSTIKLPEEVIFTAWVGYYCKGMSAARVAYALNVGHCTVTSWIYGETIASRKLIAKYGFTTPECTTNVNAMPLGEKASIKAVVKSFYAYRSHHDL